MLKKTIYRLFFLWMVINQVQAQRWTIEMPVVSAIKQTFHDKIDKSQQKIIGLKCKQDSVFIATSNIDVNLYITYFLKNKIDSLQYFVETNISISEADKYKWLRGINDMLEDYISQYKKKEIEPLHLYYLINNYQKAMLLQMDGRAITPTIAASPLDVGTILITNFAFAGNSGIDESKLILVYKLCKKNPENTLKILSKYPNLQGADSLIIEFAYLNPQELYDYAASNSDLGKRIRNIKEPMVSAVAQMATVNEGRFLFPFLDEIIAKKISVNDIVKTINDADAYFKLLVKTQISYTQQQQQGNKPFSMDALNDKIKAKALENYITPINALHDESNAAIRFDKIKNLSPQELYFVTVMGEEELYTSSFINGVYPKIIQDLGKSKTDTLLKLVHYGYYRKFLKMCASFNMLEDFLAKMDRGVAENLLKNFASNLDEYTSLEEAVDVADSYGSIKDSSIKKIISNEVMLNLKIHTENANKKGTVIYGLLNQIFLSFDSSGKTDIAGLFKIPTINFLSNTKLKDEKGRINVQQFFYGDKDGKEYFADFVNTFRGFGWRVINKANWVEVIGNGNTPITIYANKPLSEDEGLDDAAQKKLYDYLDSLSIYPTIAIHRGHSYYVKSSIRQITSYAQLVLLGSCGGYHSLSKVLSISPQAQIIASKQIGTGVINMAMIDLIMDNLKQGKDLNWQQLWLSLENKFVNRKELKERFDDYIPPYKNLGALFIMAYYKAMEGR
ncbi:MAG: hypothetical protein ACOVO1_04345 [Chitinophagaceae bacterium]